MQVNLTKYAQKLLLALKEHLHTDEDSDVIEEAVLQLYQRYVDEGTMQDVIDQKPHSLMAALEISGCFKKEYLCILNNLHATKREYVIVADSEEDAWQQMAIRFPNETKHGFTIEVCEDSELDL
jgi:dsRNA-specific ribonuclease